MTPEKTGAIVWVAPYQCWLVCDAFVITRGYPFDNIYIFRATHVAYNTPPRDRMHYWAHEVLEWWKDSIVQTIVATKVQPHNLPDGVPV